MVLFVTLVEPMKAPAQLATLTKDSLLLAVPKASIAHEQPLRPLTADEREGCLFHTSQFSRGWSSAQLLATPLVIVTYGTSLPKRWLLLQVGHAEVGGSRDFGDPVQFYR